MTIEYEPLDAELAAHYAAHIGRRVMRLNERERLRFLGLLSELERLEAEPIPDNPLEIRHD